MTVAAEFEFPSGLAPGGFAVFLPIDTGQVVELWELSVIDPEMGPGCVAGCVRGCIETKGSDSCGRQCRRIPLILSELLCSNSPTPGCVLCNALHWGGVKSGGSFPGAGTAKCSLF